jgi:hypothetical protein
MTKEKLEILRNENKDKFVQTCHNVARLFKEFADRIREGGLLTESDWKLMNETEFVDIPCHDKNIANVPITYLFSDSIDTDDDIMEVNKNE